MSNRLRDTHQYANLRRRRQVTSSPRTTASGLLIGGEWVDGGEPLPVLDKYSGEPFAELRAARPEDVDRAVAVAAATADGPALPAWRRAEILEGAADRLGARADEVLSTYVAETGFTRADAAAELKRARETLRLAAGEALRLTGETVPVEASPGSEGRLAFTLRVPVGVVCAIAPFNAPLNTVAHKVAPALAAGNAVVLKPAAATPLCSVALCEALLDAGLPEGWLSLVVGSGATVGARLVADRRIRYFTFTGSTAVGLAIKQGSGIAKTHLELGSNSAVIVCADADVDAAAGLIVRAGYRKAGQVCTSVQRVLVDAAVAGDLAAALAERAGALVAGDPRAEDTDVGPLIAPGEAERAAGWVADAAAAGAEVLTGGARDRALLEPVVLDDVPLDARVMREEIFAPVVALRAVSGVEEALAIANDTEYGLQAGVFTRDVDTAFHLARRLRVGGVMVNDTSSYHADAMPYGGVKESGYGLEGPRYAVQDMTDPRIVVLNLSEPGRAA
jgi:acyl-CoA reductase-like NAD-dependent aldehyde dehydrogenase